MPESITREEWLAELEALANHGPAQGPNGFTRQQLQDHFKWGVDKAQKQIRQWVIAGLVEYAGPREAKNVVGVRMLEHVFRPVSKRKART